MLLKFVLVLFSVGVWAEDLPRVRTSHMVYYKPGCDDDLVNARRELMQASFTKDGFQVIQGIDPVPFEAIEALYQKIASQVSAHGSVDFSEHVNAPKQVPPVLEPILRYVREAIDKVTHLGFGGELNLIVKSAEIHVMNARLEADSENAYLVKFYPDDDYMALTITFKGTPAFVRSNGQIVSAPPAMPLLISGEPRAAKFPQIAATDLGEPIRLEKRLEVVVKLRPSKGGPVRFELVQ